MTRRTRRVVLGALTALAAATLTAGCSSESLISDAAQQTAESPSQSLGSTRDAQADPPTGPTGAQPSADGTSTPTTDDSGSEPSPGVEVPVAAEPTVDSLAELLEGMDTSPLVSEPLPRAARARGRLVRAFPDLLRPARASLVDSSSIAPSDDRLQVGLVASTSLAPGQVLLAYRTRLARRGLAEQTTPVTAAGSQAAAFRRGRSVVTVTVTAQGSRTSYSVHASLHTGGE